MSDWLDGLLPVKVNPRGRSAWRKSDELPPPRSRRPRWADDLVPTLVRLIPERGKTRNVGVLPDGRQFFVTESTTLAGNDYIAVYLFDRRGRLVDHRIRYQGPEFDAYCDAIRLLIAAGARLTPITIAPFELVHDGERFGMVPVAIGDKEGDVLERQLDVHFSEVTDRITPGMTIWVERVPGYVDLGMVPPWHGGGYDT